MTSDNQTSKHGAIITGAAKGIGRATALSLSHHDVRILAVDRDEDALAQLVTEISDKGGVAHAHVADVSDSTDVRSFVDHAIRLFNGVDYFFNNAGIIGRLAPLVDYPEDVFDQVIAVNLRGAFLGLKYVLPGMYERGSGAVVNTASVAGLVGHIDHAGYVASKHGIVGLTKVAGAEAAAYGVRVNAVAPGPVHTQMMDAIEAMKSPEDADVERQRLLQNIPAHRYGTVTDIAAVVLFLLIGESNYLNGATITVDGAFTAIR
jgi:NAD(P)-dependent dehydrogenase (short-subunit alcohol dehydrogenase family)